MRLFLKHFIKLKKMLNPLFIVLLPMLAGMLKEIVGICRSTLQINLPLQLKVLTGITEAKIIDTIIMNGLLMMVGYGEHGVEP